MAQLTSRANTPQFRPILVTCSVPPRLAGLYIPKCRVRAQKASCIEFTINIHFLRLSRGSGFYDWLGEEQRYCICCKLCTTVECRFGPFGMSNHTDQFAFSIIVEHSGYSVGKWTILYFRESSLMIAISSDSKPRQFQVGHSISSPQLMPDHPPVPNSSSSPPVTTSRKSVILFRAIPLLNLPIPH